MSTLCHCGRPLHYSSPGIQSDIEELVAAFGEHITVQLGRRKWLVPRHYIALHGLRAKDLPDLGFQEIGPGTEDAEFIDMGPI